MLDNTRPTLATCVPGQGGFKHRLDFLDPPGHSSPPFSARCTTRLLDFLVPRPHDALQSLQFSHCAHVQSSRNCCVICNYMFISLAHLYIRILFQIQNLITNLF